jgi:spore coat protein H
MLFSGFLLVKCIVVRKSDLVPSRVGSVLCLLTLFFFARLHAATAEPLFSMDQLVPITIHVPPSGITDLRSNPREYVFGKIRLGTNEAVEARVRLKGNWSFQPIDNKPGFSLSFSSREAQAQFGGRTRLLLNNSLQDESFMRTKLASELFLKAGLPTARINFAAVTLNGRNLGLYLLVEATEERFLQQHFGSAQGNLYEGADQDIDAPLEIDSSPRGSDRSDLRLLLAACAGTDLQKRWKALNAKFRGGARTLASFIAMEVLVGHMDGYSMDRNNYRLYADESGKFAFIAHGMDLTFYYPVLRQDRPWRGVVASALYETPEGRKVYVECIRELGKSIYGSPSLLTDRVEDLWKIAQPAFIDPGERAGAREKVQEFKSILASRARSFHAFSEHPHRNSN